MVEIAVRIINVSMQEKNAYDILATINSIAGRIVAIVPNIDSSVQGWSEGVKELWVFYEPKET